MTREDMVRFLEGCPDDAELVLVVGHPEGPGSVAFRNVEQAKLRNPTTAGVWLALFDGDDDEPDWPGRGLVREGDDGAAYAYLFPGEGVA